MNRQETKFIKKIRMTNTKGILVEMEIHPNTDTPDRWPDRISEVGDGMLVLSGVHSTYYQPTEENKKALIQRIQKAKSWCYAVDLGKVRE